MKFSVIMPAYNAALYIKNSINSVLNQTFGDFEILIVDDGSTDDTKEIVNSVKDDRIHYIYQRNGGVSSARNTGISNAKGEYICFLDADDLWKPNHLEVIEKLIEKYPAADVFLTGHEILLRDGRFVTRACPEVSCDAQIDNMFEYIVKHGYFFHTNSMACKKITFDDVGLFEIGVKNGEDDDMWYRLFSYYSTAVSSTVTTVYVRENSRATVNRVFVDDWVFLRRVDGIMSSSRVSEEKKVYLRRLLEQRKLSFVRHCILSGDKKTVRKQIKLIDKSLVKKKKYFETLIALLLPCSVSAFFVKNRDKQYYAMSSKYNRKD